MFSVAKKFRMLVTEGEDSSLFFFGGGGGGGGGGERGCV